MECTRRGFRINPGRRYKLNSNLSLRVPHAVLSFFTGHCRPRSGSNPGGVILCGRAARFTTKVEVTRSNRVGRVNFLLFYGLMEVL
jgi:hypothetical protein